MMNSFIEQIKKSFNANSSKIFSLLTDNESLTISINAEDSFFTRINNSKIRQTTSVVQGNANFILIKDNKKIEITTQITGDINSDLQFFSKTLNRGTPF